MNKASETYKLIEHIHDSFITKNDVLTYQEIIGSGVKLDFGTVKPNITERIRATGVIDDRPAYQSLAKDRNGTYHLSTVYTENNGEHIQYDYPPGCSLELIEGISTSLFMRNLVQIAIDRS